MAKKLTVDVVVLDVQHVTVSAEPAEPALIGFKIDGQADLRLRLTAETVAKLEAMLAAASVEQAKHNPVQ